MIKITTHENVTYTHEGRLIFMGTFNECIINSKEFGVLALRASEIKMIEII